MLISLPSSVARGRGRRTVEILAPAKVNLFLEVLNKRNDGYHAIDTVMCPIRLFDRLTFEWTQSPEITLELVLPEPTDAADPAWAIPADGSNLIARALQRIQARLGTSHGCHVRVEKTIPAAAGLAGGSSDAAAAVCAGLLLWSHWQRDLATSVCAALGSDIPFFLGDIQRVGMGRAEGRGEQITLLATTTRLEFILLHPPVGCSTAEVYRRVKPATSPRSAEQMIAACGTGAHEKIGIALFNALQSSAAELTEWIARLLKIFREAGLEYSTMSGSGSACFALIDPVNTTAAVLAEIESAACQAGVSRCFRTMAHDAPCIEEQI